MRPEVAVNLGQVNRRLLLLARQQSEDIKSQLIKAGVRIIAGDGRLDGPNRLVVSTGKGKSRKDFDEIEADTLVVAVGASPRHLPTAKPDGERIFTWTQLYSLEEVPEHMIVVGSGVTGAEFASAYLALGSKVTLVSSREQVLPGEDADAARVIENVFTRNGMDVLNKSRASKVERTKDGVRRDAHRRPDGRGIPLPDGGRLDPQHGGHRSRRGRGAADRERTHPGQPGRPHLDAVASTRPATAATSCRWHPSPRCRAAPRSTTRWAMRWRRPSCATSARTSSPSPRSPPSAGRRSRSKTGIAQGDIYKLPLASNPRAKMMGIKDGFVKIFARTGSGTVIGGVIVAPKASDLILPISLAVEHRLTVDQLARAFSVYPSLSASVTDAARAMHIVG